MRTAFGILLLIGLLTSPIGCLASCPHQNHECCSKPSAQTICPYDILSNAKAALPAIPAVIIEPVAAVILSSAPLFVETREFDGEGLHLFNRVLRI